MDCATQLSHDVYQKWTLVEIQIMGLSGFREVMAPIEKALETHPSDGRFQYDNPYSISANGNLQLWFELEEDATYFTLRFK